MATTSKASWYNSWLEKSLLEKQLDKDLSVYELAERIVSTMNFLVTELKFCELKRSIICCERSLFLRKALPLRLPRALRFFFLGNLRLKLAKTTSWLLPGSLSFKPYGYLVRSKRIQLVSALILLFLKLSPESSNFSII